MLSAPLLLLACASTPATELPVEATAAHPVHSDEALTDPSPATSGQDQVFASSHMSTHYTLLTVARDAVIRGDLEATQEPLGWLIDHHTMESIPQDFRPYLHEMRGAARVAKDAGSVEAAAQGIATVASVCGECHARQGVGPKFTTETALPDRRGVNWHMARHRWAADRMWEGLIAPSDTQWKLGVTALQEDPLEQEELHAGMEMSEDEAAVATWLHQMGEFGTHMEGSVPRASYYGEFLSNCSSCHSSIGNGPLNTSPQ